MICVVAGGRIRGMPVHDSVSSRSLAYNSSILVRRSINDGSVSSPYLPITHVKQEKPSTGTRHLLIIMIHRF